MDFGKDVGIVNYAMPGQLLRDLPDPRKFPTFHLAMTLRGMPDWRAMLISGGGNDLIARVIAARLQGKLGQPVVVENKPGAQSIVAAELVAAGHAVLVVPGPSAAITAPVMMLAMHRMLFGERHPIAVEPYMERHIALVLAGLRAQP